MPFDVNRNLLHETVGANKKEQTRNNTNHLKHHFISFTEYQINQIEKTQKKMKKVFWQFWNGEKIVKSFWLLYDNTVEMN
jgi:hypothetical protein